MKITVLVILVGIGLLAWYHFPEPPPESAPAATPPTASPASPEPASKNQRLAKDDDACERFVASPQWPFMRRAYPGMSDAALCDYMLEPHVSKLQGINVNPQAIEEFLNSLVSQSRHDNDDLTQVPDLRYYLDPQAVNALRGLTEEQLVDMINKERSAEAAYLLAQSHHVDEDSRTSLLLIAASYSRKTGLFINAINGCCSWATGDAAGRRAATIRREALSMIAKDLGLPEAERWPELSPTDEIAAEVLQQREAYIAEINEHSVDAHGEEWIK